MRTRSLTNTLLALILLTGGPTFAAEFYDEAEVIRTEPITRTRHHHYLAIECYHKPETHNLLELLHWDLGTGYCSVDETTETIIGYRVHYQWDGQVFSRVLAERPGSHISVRVVLE